MTALLQLQRDFKSHVLYLNHAVADRIAATPEVPVATRLGIYADAYRLRLIEVLATDFSKLQALAGDDLFDRLCRAYIDAHPSEHFSVRYFGRYLAEFLAVTPPYRETPVLSEMAALEWALSLAFDAADDPVVTVDDVASLDPGMWPQLRLGFHASVQRLQCAWNTTELWSALDQGADPISQQALSQPEPWLVWRRELQCYFRALPQDEVRVLDAARGGACFAELCEVIAERVAEEQIALTAAGHLKAWVRGGLIAALHTSGK